MKKVFGEWRGQTETGIIIKIESIDDDNVPLGESPEHSFKGFINEEVSGRCFSGKTLKEAKENASKKVKELFDYSGNISWEQII